MDKLFDAAKLLAVAGHAADLVPVAGKLKLLGKLLDGKVLERLMPKTNLLTNLLDLGQGREIER